MELISSLNAPTNSKINSSMCRPLRTSRSDSCCKVPAVHIIITYLDNKHIVTCIGLKKMFQARKYDHDVKLLSYDLICF